MRSRLLDVVFCLVFVCVSLFSVALAACKYAAPSCRAIHVADDACHTFVLEDGSTVQASPVEVRSFVRSLMAEHTRDAGALDVIGSVHVIGSAFGVVPAPPAPSGR